MGKGKLSALLIAVAIIGLALMRTATASHTTDHKAFSGGSEFRGLVVKTDREPTGVTAEAPDWQTVDSRGFQIPAGESQLVVARFFAETLCSDLFVSSESQEEYTGGACYVRVMVGRTLEGATELEPASGANAAIDSVYCCDERETHALSRALCVRNATASPLNISVWVQAATGTNGNGPPEIIFELDDWTFEIARNAPCTPAVNI